MIGCRLRRIRTGGSLCQFVQFSKNGEDVGYPLAVKMFVPLYPSFWMASTGVVVESNLDQTSIKNDLDEGRVSKQFGEIQLFQTIK